MTVLFAVGAVVVFALLVTVILLLLQRRDPRKREFMHLVRAAEVLADLTAKDEKAALARMAVRAIQKRHYPEEERRYYGHDASDRRRRSRSKHPHREGRDRVEGDG